MFWWYYTNHFPVYLPVRWFDFNKIVIPILDMYQLKICQKIIIFSNQNDLKAAILNIRLVKNDSLALCSYCCKNINVATIGEAALILHMDQIDQENNSWHNVHKCKMHLHLKQKYTEHSPSYAQSIL